METWSLFICNEIYFVSDDLFLLLQSNELNINFSIYFITLKIFIFCIFFVFFWQTLCLTIFYIPASIPHRFCYSNTFYY